MADAMWLRGEGLFEGTAARLGATTVVLQAADGGEREVPTWRVATFDLDGAPEGLARGLDLLGEGRFEEAARALQAVADAKAAAAGPRDALFRGWAGLHAANARRIEAEVAGRGARAAAEALQAWVAAHEDDALLAHALAMTCCAWLAAGDAPKARSAADALAAAKHGPVWAAQAEVLRARADLVAGDAVKALARLDALLARPAPEHGREVHQLALAWAVEAQRRAEPEKALRRVPVVKDPDGRELLAPFDEAWHESPAAPLLLNAIGEALRDWLPGAEGAAAAAPFFLRVNRWHANAHAEHARALALGAASFETTGQAEWAASLRAVLRDRYPGAGAAPGALGGG